MTLQTIRRDLAELAEQGRLQRIHGGATLPSGLRNIGYDHRSQLNAVPILSANGNNTIMVTGGRLRQADGGLVGQQTAASARQFKFDLAIIGCSALDENGDLFDYDLDEVNVSQTVIENSHTTALVADNTKFERIAPARIAPLSCLGLFCTGQAPHQLLPDVVGSGPNLMIAPK